MAVVAIVYAQPLMTWAGSSALATATSAAIAQGVVGGAIIGFVAGGDLRSTISGGLSGALFGGIGELGFSGFEKILAHAAGGCFMGAASGGDCRSGALAAGAGAALGPAFKGLGSIGEGIARAVMGGTFSVLGGGKFANGAVTAAYAYMFNDAAHERKAETGVRSSANCNGAAICRKGFEYEREKVRFIQKDIYRFEPDAGALGYDLAAFAADVTIPMLPAPISAGMGMFSMAIEFGDGNGAVRTQYNALYQNVQIDTFKAHQCSCDGSTFLVPYGDPIRSRIDLRLLPDSIESAGKVRGVQFFNRPKPF